MMMTVSVATAVVMMMQAVMLSEDEGSYHDTDRWR